MKDATIYHVAEKAGVSVSTVSRVLNGFVNVKDETRQKVLKAIEDCKFYPNINATGLANRSTKLIGILVGDIRASQYVSGVYFIEQELSKNGYSCVIFNTGHDPKQQAKTLLDLLKRRVEAVVLVGETFQNNSVYNILSKKMPTIPVAVCNCSFDGDNIYSISSNAEQGCQEIVCFLASKGRKNMAFVTTTPNVETDKKIRGFAEGFDRYVKNGRKHIKAHVYNSEEIVSAVEEVLKEDPELDSIVTNDDFVAFVTLHVLLAKGIKVPEQIAVVGINNSRYAEFSNPPLTSLNTMPIDVCLIAARNIMDVLKGEQVNHSIQLMPVLVERSST